MHENAACKTFCMSTNTGSNILVISQYNITKLLNIAVIVVYKFSVFVINNSSYCEIKAKHAGWFCAPPFSVFHFTRGSAKYLCPQTKLNPTHNSWHGKPHNAVYTHPWKTTIYCSESGLFSIKHRCWNTFRETQRTKAKGEHVVAFESNQKPLGKCFTYGKLLMYISERLKFKGVLNLRQYSVLINICNDWN